MTKEKKEAIRQRLAEIEARNRGRLTPDAVIHDAKDKDSPLHDQFEWDKTKAAYAHWQDQARALITSVRVIITTETSTIKSIYYVRDPSAASKDQGYVSVDKLRTDQDMARDALVAEFSRVADLLRRARELATVLEMQDEVTKLIDGTVGLRQRVQDMPSATM